jgi:hypothetical protein
VRCFIDIRELEGFEFQAMWDDLSFGLAHNNEFEKIAVLGNSKIYQIGVKISNWLVSYEIEYFENETKAKNWIEE